MATATATELFETNLRLADCLANKFRRRFSATVQFDDLQQQARLALWQAAAEYRPRDEHANFAGYASSLITWRMTDYVRGWFGRKVKKEYRTNCSSLDVCDTRKTPAQECEQHDFARYLIGTLSPTQREIVRLMYEEGLDQKQTAERLGMTPMQVHHAHKRILALLKRRAEKQCS